MRITISLYPARQDLDATTTRELTAVQEERAATFGLQVAEY